MPYDVFWNVAVDFRKFDISVPRFGFVNRTPTDLIPAVETPDGNYYLQDEIRLPQFEGERFADAFMGNGLTRNGQTLTGGDALIYVDFAPVSGAVRGYILPNMLPFSITQLNSVIDSVGTKDDIALLRSMLGGSNEIRLGGVTGNAKGNNFVFAGAGDDRIYGAAGQDTLKGDGGQDTVNGYDGHDRLYGGAGNDLLSGGAGDDILFGGAGGNQLFGDFGRDTINGGSAAESIMGGAGADRIMAGGGDDAIYGNEGADFFVYRKNHGHDAIQDFQDGVDKIVIEAPGGTNLGSFVKTNFTGGCTISNAALNIEITLLGVSKSQISLAEDFIFVAF
ncbi:calcium-binding protein [Neogemmobacter tilapiae]|uniref:Calcium-binding protein n=1 Tax=Neogemmobacter tilapiae TaxID=875041 RepID=A0A918WGK5_9RHOB|nr:calcium-binding protein [Gemmobacter tilapiae]GHC49343.1 hypothetical protein GCM10007315_09360 [Gemmobacter tilapiae]